VLGRYNAVVIEDALRASPPRPPFPPADDRVAWTAIRHQLGPAETEGILARAVQAASGPLSPLPATLYLEFMRNGAREGYEQPAHRRREHLRNLALAECLEAEGRFTDGLLDVAWAICEESSWAWPAHQRELTDPDRPVIDLAVAMTALELAELNALLGSRLHAALGRRIQAEVDRRCFVPYLGRHDHWWLHGAGRGGSLNNWTAVCNGGVAGAAIYLEPDPARLAEILARAMPSLDEYLATFDPDGGSAEGPGYWSYGFGYFTILAHLIEQRTSGRICPLDGERIRHIAQFPLRTLLSPGSFVNFSDCDRHINLTAPHLAFLGQRLELPGLSQLARQQHTSAREHELTWGLRGLMWQAPDRVDGRWTPAKHDWFSGQHWMIGRIDPGDSNALVLAAKGGHNAEPHNQNDVGTIIVHASGESIVADPGRGRYTRFYFGPERYDHFVNSSAGHSVPVPNGQSQLPGREHAAVLLDHQADSQHDTLALELMEAYPSAADLTSLRRSVTLQRDTSKGRIELVDQARFATAPGTLESVLITFGAVEIGPSTVRLQGDRGALAVRFDSTVVTPRLELVEKVDLAEGLTDVRRVVFGVSAPAREANIRLAIEPA
jgi:Heparinase II/III-like protein